MFGITRGTTAAHIARAALESIAFQSAELVQAMRQDARTDLQVLKVDGGAAASNMLMQFQADLLDCPIQRPKMTESTAWGAASLAGIAAGIWSSFDDLRRIWLEDQTFLPKMDEDERARRFQLWKRGVERVRDWELPA
jgi:glycerol kinase